LNVHRSPVAVAACVVLALVGAACSSSSTPSASALAQSAYNKAIAADSFSLNIVATQQATKKVPHPPVESLKISISASQASQSLRFSNGSGNTDVISVGGTEYVRGDYRTLYFGLGLTPQNASTYAGQWLSITPSDSIYSEISNTLTPDATIGSFIPVGTTVTVGPTRTLDGHTVTPLQGPVKPNSAIAQGLVRLYIDSTSHLPVAAGVVGFSKAGVKLSEVVKFSNFGTPLHLMAPSPSIPFASVYGSKGG
jgi:hypothetical protein